MGVPGTAQIWSQTFHEALFRSLRDSQLFADVRREGKARCVLRADILSQTTTGYSGSFAVRYTLSDGQATRDVWTEQIATSYTFPTTTSVFVAPYNTQLRALMRAGVADIAMLLDRLSALLCRPLRCQIRQPGRTLAERRPALRSGRSLAASGTRATFWSRPFSAGHERQLCGFSAVSV